MGSKVDRRNPGWYSFSLAGELLNLLSGSKWHPRVPFYTGMLTVKGRQAQREPGNPTPAPPRDRWSALLWAPKGEAFSRPQPSAGFLSRRKTAFALQTAPGAGPS